MMEKSWVAMFAFVSVLFGVSGTVGVEQELDPPKAFVQRTVTQRETNFGFGDLANAKVTSKVKAAGTVSRAMVTEDSSVALPKSVGAPVLIEAKVYQLNLRFPQGKGRPTSPTLSEALAQIAAGQHKLIAAPTIVGSSGNPTSFQSVVNVTLAKAYSPPTIPKSYDGVVTGGLTVGKKAVLKTNDGDGIMPPHPIEFEKRDVGLTLNFLPKIRQDGSVSVKCDFENSALGPFADYGSQIIRETKKLIGKKTKTEVMLENNQFLPTIISQKTSVTAIGKLGESASKLVEYAPADYGSVHGTAPIAGDFAKILVQNGLPPLLVSVSAKKIEVAEPKEKVVVNKETQIFLTVRAVEISDEPQVISGVPEIKAGLMSDPQFQVLIRALNKERGVDLLTAPSIMVDGIQAGKIEVVREFIYPTKYRAPEIHAQKPPASKDDKFQSFPVTPATPLEFRTMNTGIEFGVMARAVDGNSIELQLKPEVTEFKGFLNFGEPILVHDYEKTFGKPVSVVMTENRIEMPIFDKRRLETTVRIPDGGTICLGGFVLNETEDVQDKVPFLGDLPMVGQAFRSDVELHTQRRLYFFVRAELQDPAGMAIRRK